MSADGIRATVERNGWLDWQVYMMTRYSGLCIAHFWTKRGAERVAARLNQFESERADTIAREAEYTEALKAIVIVAD